MAECITLYDSVADNRERNPLTEHHLVDKLADYEDELRQLKSAQPASPTITTNPPPRPSSSAGLASSTIQSRFSLLLPSTRRAISQNDLKDPNLTHNNPTSADLLTALTREQGLRQAAETRVNQTNDEIEELSTQLFTEANAMVATERKARAKLEERVAVLERRDKEKRGRLEALEGRLGRIERVRALLKHEA